MSRIRCSIYRLESAGQAPSSSKLAESSSPSPQAKYSLNPVTKSFRQSRREPVAVATCTVGGAFPPVRGMKTNRLEPWRGRPAPEDGTAPFVERPASPAAARASSRRAASNGGLPSPPRAGARPFSGAAWKSAWTPLKQGPSAPRRDRSWPGPRRARDRVGAPGCGTPFVRVGVVPRSPFSGGRIRPSQNGGPSNHGRRSCALSASAERQSRYRWEKILPQKTEPGVR